MRDAVEAGIEREALKPRFYRSSPTDMVTGIIAGLGLSDKWRAGLGPDDVFRRWIIARPGDPTGPLILPEKDGDIAALKERWPRSRPPPDSG